MRKTSTMRWSSRVLLLAFLAAVTLNARTVSSQALTPKDYQNVNPPDSAQEEGLNVYVSALLERLLKVDDKDYEFTATMFLYFSWLDPGARQQMEESTIAYRNATGECFMPCVSDSKPSRKATGFAAEYSCCDEIWLPQVVAYNLLPPYHTQFDGLIVGTDGTVGWYKSIYGKYFTSMEFSTFPLDTQNLQVSLGLNSVSHGNSSQGIRFVPSASSTVFMMKQGIEGHQDGKKVDSVSGWQVENVSMESVEVPLMESVEYFIYYFGTGSDKSDPMPMVGTTGSSSPPASPFTNPALHHYGLNIYIEVKRISSYYIINQIVPIYVLVLVSMVTYFHNPSKIDTRIAVNVTCFLALTAIKWVVNRELPNSSYPTPVTLLIITAYALFGFAVVESIVVHTVYKKAENEKQGDEKNNKVDYEVLEPSKATTPPPSGSNSLSNVKTDSQGFKLLSSRKWTTFSKGIRRVKGDHEHDVTELAIIIDMTSLTLAILTTVISSAVYFT
jgi:hypothetical protein